jgi:CheY-like chemotaxis protein
VVKSKRILICDDSPIVHKALARLLPESDFLTLHFAENGRAGLECLSQYDIDVLFLDLTMPVMDGFGVLKSLPVRNFDTKVVVVSADVQKQAIERCFALGAQHFLSKPFDSNEFKALLTSLDLSVESHSSLNNETLPIRDFNYLNTFKEVANIALGRGAAIISDHFGEFIKMPLPNVAHIDAGEWAMTVTNIKNTGNTVAIAQRFVGGGINGEALVCLRGDDIGVFGERLGFSQMDENKNEIVTDTANLMVSSFLVALSEQMNIPFSVRQPIVLEEYMSWGDGENSSLELFTIEYTYQAESLDLECDVLFLMDSGSTQVIKKIMGTLH